jgi:signal transduction histidine kinase/CheY-like chemotaxis protein
MFSSKASSARENFLDLTLQNSSIEVVFVDRNDFVFFPKGDFCGDSEATSLQFFLDKYIYKYDVLAIKSMCDFENNISLDRKELCVIKLKSCDDSDFAVSYSHVDMHGVFLYFTPHRVETKEVASLGYLNSFSCIVLDSDGRIKFVSQPLLESVKYGAVLNQHLCNFAISIKTINGVDKSTQKISYIENHWNGISDGDILDFKLRNGHIAVMKVNLHDVCLNSHSGIHTNATTSTSDNISNGKELLIVLEPSKESVNLDEILRLENSLLNFMHIAYVIVDNFGRVEWFNTSFQNSISFPGEKIVGRFLGSWVKTVNAKKIAEFFESGEINMRVICSSTQIHYEIEIQQTFLNTPSGIVNVDPKMNSHEFTTERDKVLKKPTAQCARYLISLTNVTELQKKETKLIEGQKMQALGTLASKIAHDFNNLLTAVGGFCELLLLKHNDSELVNIKENTKRAANLVRQMLSFAKNGHSINPVKTDLHSVIRNLKNLLVRVVGPKIKLNIEETDSLHEVFFDIGQLEQVVVNLIVNARDAIKHGGSISVVISEEYISTPIEFQNRLIGIGKYMSLAVTDDGCGIEHKIINSIFCPFFSTKGDGGTGLGLSTVMDILMENNSYLLLDTEVGRGSKFTVLIFPYANQVSKVLPEENYSIVQKAISPSLKAKSIKKELLKNVSPQSRGLTESTEKKTKKQLRLLIVDDDDAVRIFTARALTNSGYLVVDTQNAIEALEILKKQQFDLLITDVEMGVMDGPELVSKAKKIKKDLKVLFLSGYRRESIDSHEGVNVGFLAKPFTLSELNEAVLTMLNS